VIFSTEVSGILSQQNAMLAQNANYASYLSQRYGGPGAIGPYAGSGSYGEIGDPRALLGGGQEQGQFQYGGFQGAPGSGMAAFGSNAAGGLVKGAIGAAGMGYGALQVASLFKPSLATFDPLSHVFGAFSKGFGSSVGGGATGFVSGLKTAWGMGGMAGVRAAGMGLLGGVAAAALPAAAAYAGYKVAEFGIERIRDGLEQQAATNAVIDAFGIRANMPGLGNHRWSFNEKFDVGTTIRGMARENIWTNVGELNTVLAQGMQSGAFSNIRNPADMSGAIKELVGTLREVGRTMNTTLTGAFQYYQELRGMGFAGNQVGGAAATIRSLTAPGGISSNTAFQFAQMGSQAALAAGGTAADARRSAINATAFVGRIGTQVATGAISEDRLFEMTGQRGEAGAASLAGQMQQAASVFMHSRYGRIAAMSMMDPLSGEFNADRIGNMSTLNSQVRGARNALGSRDSRVSWMLNQENIREQMMSQLGPDVALGMGLQGLAERLGGFSRNPEMTELLLQRRTGLDRKMIRQAMFSAATVGGQRLQQGLNQDSELERQATESYIKENANLTAVGRKLWRGVTEWASRPLEESSAWIGQTLNEEITDYTERLMGVRRTPVSGTVQNAYSQAQRGYSGGLERLRRATSVLGQTATVRPDLYGGGHIGYLANRSMLQATVSDAGMSAMAEAMGISSLSEEEAQKRRAAGEQVFTTFQRGWNAEKAANREAIASGIAAPVGITAGVIAGTYSGGTLAVPVGYGAGKLASAGTRALIGAEYNYYTASDREAVMQRLEANKLPDETRTTIDKMGKVDRRLLLGTLDEESFGSSGTDIEKTRDRFKEAIQGSLMSDKWKKEQTDYLYGATDKVDITARLVNTKAALRGRDAEWAAGMESTRGKSTSDIRNMIQGGNAWTRTALNVSGIFTFGLSSGIANTYEAYKRNGIWGAVKTAGVTLATFSPLGSFRSAYNTFFSSDADNVAKTMANQLRQKDSATSKFLSEYGLRLGESGGVDPKFDDSLSELRAKAMDEIKEKGNLDDSADDILKQYFSNPEKLKKLSIESLQDNQRALDALRQKDRERAVAENKSWQRVDQTLVGKIAGRKGEIAANLVTDWQATRAGALDVSADAGAVKKREQYLSYLSSLSTSERAQLSRAFGKTEAGMLAMASSYIGEQFQDAKGAVKKRSGSFAAQIGAAFDTDVGDILKEATKEQRKGTFGKGKEAYAEYVSARVQSQILENMGESVSPEERERVKREADYLAKSRLGGKPTDAAMEKKIQEDALNLKGTWKPGDVVSGSMGAEAETFKKSLVEMTKAIQGATGKISGQDPADQK